MVQRYTTAVQDNISKSLRGTQLEGCGERKMPRLYELADKRSASLRCCNLPVMGISTTVTDENMNFCDKKDGTHCSYCSAPYGAKVLYNGRITILHKVKEHFMPKSIRGRGVVGEGRVNSKYITRSCQICNNIKKARVFETGTDAQNYILDKLLESDWALIEEPTRKLSTQVSV